MTNQVKIFILIIGLLILGTIGAVLLQSDGTPAGPGKYDAFATCLKDKGAIFYGAFWCPHCQDEKKLFGSSAHLLPYVECSNPNANGQNQTCNDKQIESYPTWEFVNPIKLTETAAPNICAKKVPGVAAENSTCNQVASSYGKVWLFPDTEIESGTEPVQTGNVWSFMPGSQLRGLVPLQQLANQTTCPLPAENTAK